MTSIQPTPEDETTPELTTGAMVVLELATPTRDEAVAVLAERLLAARRIADLPGFLSDVHRHEHQLATGLPGGIGLAHARSSFVAAPSICVGVMAYGHGLDFGAKDGAAHVVLLLATPASSYSGHLSMLAALARSLAKESFRESLRRANDPGVIAELINSTVDFSTV
ncbi:MULTISPECIES: PTS sugar transporter subunit IIA [Paeniglutamicibacter]|uniref:PTS system fructose-specific IIA component n=1 Tax=Paeniglutamicibacter sulfureus TaxID=43666 RepID=A0ABU2BN05_9MICC|nr:MULTISPECIES: PTS sugar transporter subunit IIA [Paeniglutamicibacter]MCV9995619.1 PTS sugar transporter subunit IIA [Paeniglutamicibacter sp. ZC-3]MDR7360038.1 PTS system fructose-specific IIA component [Paeniglutamicibacter sulfureus]